MLNQLQKFLTGILTDNLTVNFLRFSLLLAALVLAKQSSQLSTYITSADNAEKNGENFSEICAKKEFDGKTGLRKEG